MTTRSGWPSDADWRALIVSGLGLGEWAWSRSDDAVVCSQRARDLLGIAEHEVCTGERLLASLHPDDRTKLRASGRRVVEAGEDLDVVCRTLHGTGARWIRVWGRMRRDEAGAPAGVFGAIAEVADGEAALTVGRGAASADVGPTKDEFLAMLGHELRNPLAPILTALQVMKLRDETALQRERRVIERQVAHLTRLVDDLMDVGRVATPNVALTRERIELAEVVARAVELASPLLEQRSHTLVIDVPRLGLPIDGDPARLTQVVANLLTNAGKYTPPHGRITVTGDIAGHDVVLRVSDTGVGIAPDVLPHVFGLFVQGRQSLDRAQGGLGLGLSIVRSLVERHGGTVEARSDGPDTGTEMVVRLPRATGRARARTPSVELSPARATRVLVVDDNRDAAGLLADALRLRGCSVLVAYDGREALGLTEEHPFDLMLLDLGLPEMDGFALAAALRASTHARDARLVAITGYGQDADRQRALAAGFDDHLVKPVGLGALERIVAELTPAS